MRAHRTSDSSPFLQRSACSVELFEAALVGPVGIYCDIFLPDPSTSKTGQQLEDLVHGLACDYAVEAYDLGFARSILEVAPVWTVKFQDELFVGEKAAAPKTEPARDERYDVAPNGHAKVPLLYVFDRADAYSDINVGDKEAPRYVLKI